MNENKLKNRAVRQIIAAVETEEGEGFIVRRPFPGSKLSQVDPFLLLDHFGPVEQQPGAAKGAPDHPHRGFETVTYMLAGEFEHKDSTGRSGTIRAGDVQWMTAGAGVVHSEMPSGEFQKQGGTLEGFQLWVNLPKKDKMIAPNYQELAAEQIPTATSADGLATVKIIAGESFGKRAVTNTRTPIFYLHFTVQPGGEVRQAVPAEHNAFAYVLRGAGRFGRDENEARESQLVLFERDADEINFFNDSNQTLEVLLIAGEPINEPVARYGPFLMNTQDEIYQAIEDYRAGKMGAIAETV